MSSRITASTGVIDRIDTKEIRVFRDGTPMKWSGALKHPSIYLLNTANVAKLSIFQSGVKAVMGNDSYVIGTDSQAWSFDILAGSVIQVGIATDSHSLTSLDANGDHVSVQLNVTTGDKIVFLLELDTLVIEHQGVTRTIDIARHFGKTMRAWLSDVNGTGFSVSIGQYRFINISIDELNTARIATQTTKTISIPLTIDTGDKAVGLGTTTFNVAGITTGPGQDFSITSSNGDGIKVYDADGSVEMSALWADLIQHPTTGPLIMRGGVSARNGITLDQNGDLVVDSGNIVTQCVKAPAGNSTSIVADGGGINISSDGAVTFDVPSILDTVESNLGNDLKLIGGGSITIESGTGTVRTSGIETTSVDKEGSGTLNIGSSIQSKINIGNSNVMGNLVAAEGLDVIGDITILGTVSGQTLAETVSGSVTVHSDMTDAGSNAIISTAERVMIATNAATITGSVTAHSDVTDAGSGIVISAAERSQIATNAVNATGSVLIHTDVTDVGSGAIITAAERSQLTSNAAAITGSVTAHSDVNISAPSTLDVLVFDGAVFENKSLSGAGIAADVHAHSAQDITGFNSAVDARISLQAGVANGIASLIAGKVPAVQLDIDSLTYCGTWDAKNNTPELVSSTGVNGCVYVVTVAGTTTLDTINDWKETDWVVFDGVQWHKVDNSDLVQSVAGKTGDVTLSVGDFSDLIDAGSGMIITDSERAMIATNTAAITGSVTAHNDVTDAGSGSIITDTERAQIATNNTNILGSVLIHTDVTDVGSGAIITVPERNAIIGGTTGPVTSHSDISDSGSGIIISVAERIQIGTNNTNATGSVTVHSDVTDAGSGSIITLAERTQITTNTNGNSGTVLVHSDITSAGSGAIITVPERAQIVANTAAIAGLLDLTGGTMTGAIDMNSNNLHSDTLSITSATMGVTESVPVAASVWHERAIKAEDGNDLSIESFSGDGIRLMHEGGVVVTGVLTSDTITSAGGMSIGGNLTVGTSLQLDHQITSGSAPAANNGHIYVKSGVLYFKGDDDIERVIALT